MTTEVASGPPAGSDTRALLAKIGPLVLQTGLLTALLYYFGWTRTRATAAALGLDPSLFGYGTPEYVLRSVDSMIVPLASTVSAVMAGLVFTALAARRLPSFGRRARRWLLLGPLAFGAILLVVGDIGMTALPTEWGSTRAPTVALAGAAVTALVLGTARRCAHGGIGAFAAIDDEIGRAASLVLVALAALSTFAMTSDYASHIGRGRAAALIATIPTLPATTVTSGHTLGLSQLAGVSMTTIDERADDTASPRFSYSGMKFLAKAGGYYFLVALAPDGSTARTVAVPDSPDVVLVFGWLAGSATTP